MQSKPEYDENAGVVVTDHILIRDTDTKEVLVNQRGSSKNQDLGEDDGE